jgi:hypothetical protein
MALANYGRQGTTVVNASVTRPADALIYAAGDLIANSTTAASVTPLTFTNAARVPAAPFKVVRARLTKDDDDVTAATFRLHLFTTDPTATAPTNGDNGALQLTGVLGVSIGSFTFDMTASPDIHTDGNYATAEPAAGAEISAVAAAASRDIYGLLEATGTYTPASGEVFTAYLEIVQE